MAQNLISATLAPEVALEITQNLTSAKSKFDFLSNLQKQEMSGIFKLGNQLLPFVDLANEALTTHPEIIPPVFDKEEFLRDFKLTNTLRPILSQLHELSESVQKTYTAAGSDTLVEALEIYDFVKQNKDKVPGLSVIYEKMAVFFKKAKASKVEEKAK